MVESYREGSRLLSVTRRCRDRVTSIRDGSWVLERTVGRWKALRNRATETSVDLQPLLDHSALGRLTAGVGTQFTTATDQARVRSLGRTFQRYVTGSAGYRWLTAEPDADVIVIDLRETVVGTLAIRPLEWMATTITGAATDSRFIDPLHAGHRAFRRNPIRLLGIVCLSTILPLFGALKRTGQLSVATAVGLVALTAAAGAATRARRSLSELLETRVGKALRAAFEPPSSPSAGDDTESSPEQTNKRER